MTSESQEDPAEETEPRIQRTVRFTDSEWRRYRVAAAAADQSRSDWIRDACAAWDHTPRQQRTRHYLAQPAVEPLGFRQ